MNINSGLNAANSSGGVMLTPGFPARSIARLTGSPPAALHEVHLEAFSVQGEEADVPIE